MAGKLMRNALLLAKKEATYGVDAAPIVGANPMQVMVSDAQPVVAETAERDNIRSYMGSRGEVQVSAHSQITIEFEMAGSTAAGTAPKWSPLLTACGFSETVTAATDTVYTPISSGFSSTTIYYYLDGLLHKITGAFGTPTFTINSRSIPKCSVQFTGLHNATSDTSLPPGADFSDFIKPQAVNDTNTTAFSLHGYAAVMDTLTIAANNVVPYQNFVNLEQVSINDRLAGGNVSIFMTSVADKAWHSIIKDGTLGALALTHGTTAGSIFDFAAPTVQLSNPTYSEKDGIAMLGMDMKIKPDSGNDELTITIT
jgi:hypothetical protein